KRQGDLFIGPQPDGGALVPVPDSEEPSAEEKCLGLLHCVIQKEEEEWGELEGDYDMRQPSEPRWSTCSTAQRPKVGAPHFTIRTPKDVVHMRVVQSTGAREVAKGVLMAENVRSPFDYREPPTLDSDGDGSKPPPPRAACVGEKGRGHL
ncbi:hypothetical protein INR49_000837, partial [Caranx melampygus]